MVIDVTNQLVIFQDELFPPTGLLNLPDLSISADNITFNFPGNMIRRNAWLNISAQIANLGGVDVSDALVRIFVGSTAILKDGTDNIIIDVPAMTTVPVWVNWTPEDWGLQTLFIKIYSGYNELDYSNNYAFKQILVDIQTIFVHGPDLQLTSWDILMYPETPTRGDEVKITIIVHNLGDEPVFSTDGATLIIRDTFVEWNTTNDRANYGDGIFLNETFYNVSVPANGIIQLDFLWDARPGGNVTINTYIDANNSVIETEENRGAFEYNNLATRTFKIMPKILLVDDDNITAGDFDSGARLRNAMIAAGATFDMYFVSGHEDPFYDFGSKQLKDYDIVVWTTGYEPKDTLTKANIDTIKRAMNNGTYLWLVGQDIIPEITARDGDMDGDPDPGEFAYDYLGVDEYTLPLNGTPEMLEGFDNNPISHDLRLNLSDIYSSEDRGINISVFKNDSASDRIDGVFYNNTELGIGGNSSINYYNVSRDFKAVHFGFEFGAMNNPVTRAQVAYRVLRWLNWSLTIGTDFAVAEETFSKAEPKYLDRVWINATLLNNGPHEENVTVAFYVTGPDGVERLIQRYPDFQKNPYSIDIPGEGGRVHVSKQWLATDVGLHNFRVLVDPFDAFQEISEENNDITYTDLNTKLDVAFAILVVDDDNSTNNGGGDVDMVSDITVAMDNIDYNYDIYIVPGGVNETAGPDVELMKHYNVVLWCTGTTVNYTLNESDQKQIGYYLDGIYEEAGFIPDLRVNFIMIGSNILEDLNGSGQDIDVPPSTFLERYVHVDKYSTDFGLAGRLDGIYGHPVSHGLEYQMEILGTAELGDNSTDLIVPTSDARGLFWNNGTHTGYSAVSYNSSSYNIIFIPWSYSAIAPSNFIRETNQTELMFMMLNWMGYPEKRVELRTYSVDIELSDDNPVIGNSYVLRTNVFNFGGTDTSAIVRYYDKDTIIDTQTIFIPADGNSTSEIIWVPLFAGNRTINVKVDAANDVPEVFEYLNNNASRPNEEVFFFYDDLEKGTGNWHHDSTIFRIRGESPLDYMDEPVYTDINGTWDLQAGFSNYTKDFHSSNASFYASEPKSPTGKAILDIVLIIDVSASMDAGSWPNRPIDKAKEAARTLIDYVDDESRVAIFTTSASEQQRNLSFKAEGDWIPLDDAGRALLTDTDPKYLYNTSSSSADLNPQAFTQIWTAAGEGVQAGYTMGRKGKSVAIVLSDGQDYQGSDSGLDTSKDGIFTSVEDGSAVVSASPPNKDAWCPWGDWGTYNKYPYHWGKYFGNTITQGFWYNKTFGGGAKGDWAYGLLDSPIPVYTIGLTLETATNRSGNINEPAFGYIPKTESVSFRDRHGDVYNGSGGQEFGTPEYNLYRVATTSGAKYFYAPSANDLKNIFRQIADELVTILARSSSRATDIGIETKYALTGEFSLVGMDSAKLTFYHKYNLFLGYNGAIVRIGTPNATGWAYEYVQPTQLYNSNLYLRESEQDDFGKPMLWCWNGISGNGRYDWEYAEFDLSKFIGQPRVRANFTLVLYGGGTGGGWWVDDVEIKVSRSNSNPVSSTSRDQWEWTDSSAHSGSYSWWNHNATTNHLSGGLDNSLYTRSIDLTKARNATLTAYMKFNVNGSTGRPPDGFRIEVSSDNGRIWKPINLGARTSWGVSGAEPDASDGVPNDGRSYTGLDPDNDNWVEAGTLTRLSTDLSGWRGSVIQLRFRVVTSSDTNPFWSGNHYEDASAGFGGFYIDDVIIYGESIEAENENVRNSNMVNYYTHNGFDDTLEVWEETEEEELTIFSEPEKSPAQNEYGPDVLALPDSELPSNPEEEVTSNDYTKSTSSSGSEGKISLHDLELASLSASFGNLSFYQY
jgi:hypothetical protein